MKGMQKIKRGKAFKGVICYALANDNGEFEGQIIGGNLSGTDASSISTEFAVSRKLRPAVEKPVWHNSLRLPEGDKLTADQWCTVADDYMQRMGFSELHQRTYVLHDEPEGQHIHIVASRIALDGQLYLGKNENLISTMHIQALEIEHGLTITKGPRVENGRSVAADVARPKAGEVGKYERTGEQPERYQLIAIIDKELEDKPSASVFAERLTLAGVEARANFGGEKLYGFSFSLNGVPFKGSQLGKLYTGKALTERGLRYEHNRDFTKLKRLSATYSADRIRTTDAENSQGLGACAKRRELDSSSIHGDKGKQPTNGERYAPTLRTVGHLNAENRIYNSAAKRIYSAGDETGTSGTASRGESSGKNPAAETSIARQQFTDSGSEHFTTNPDFNGCNLNSTDMKEAVDIISTGDPFIDRLLRKILIVLRIEEQKKIAKTKASHEDYVAAIRLALIGIGNNALSPLFEISLAFITEVKKANLDRVKTKNINLDYPARAHERYEKTETSKAHQPSKTISKKDPSYIPSWRRKNTDNDTPQITQQPPF